MIDLLYKRRSVRKFTNTEIEPEKIELLQQALLLAPTSRNKKPCRFFFVHGQDDVKKLKGCRKAGTLALETASLAVVITSDTSVGDVWIENAAIAATILQLEADSLGLGSCWIHGRDRQAEDGKSTDQWLKNLLGIPADLMIDSVIAIGYEAERPRAYTPADLDYSKVFTVKSE